MAQWGIQAAIHHERMTGRHGLHWMAGFGFDASDRTSIGLDLVGHLSFEPSESYVEDVIYNGYNVSYSLSRNVIGLQYRSTYFLRNDNSGAYLGPYLGFRRFDREVLVLNTYSNSVGLGSSVDPSWARTYRTTAMLFPVGMRFGIRSEMDGWYGDLYVGLGLQLGSVKETNAAPFLDEKDELKGFSFQVGYAIGMGWY